MRTGWLLAACLVLGTALTGQAVTLAYPLQKNARVAYRYEAEMTGALTSSKMPTPLNITMQAKARVVEQVTAVKGVLATIRMLTKNFTLAGTVNNESVDQTMPDSVTTFQRDRAGAIKNQHSANRMSSAALPGMGDFWQMYIRFGHRLRLPDSPIEIGDSWRIIDELPKGDGTMVPMTVDSTLVGTKVVKGVTYLQVDSLFTTETPDRKYADDSDKVVSVDFAVAGESQLLFNPKTGAVLRSTFSIENAMVMVFRNPETGEEVSMNGVFKTRGTTTQAE